MSELGIPNVPNRATMPKMSGIGADLAAGIYNIITNVNAIKGLWLFEVTGAQQTIADRSWNNHTVTLRNNTLTAINASTCSPGVSGIAPYLTFDSTHVWNTPSHADFSPTSGGGTDTKFSIVILANMVSMAGTVLFGKIDTAAIREYMFYFDGTSKINAIIYKSDQTANIGRVYSASLAGQVGSWNTYGMTYNANKSSTGIKIYNNGGRIDDTDNNAGVYNGITAGAALVGGYYAPVGWPTTGRIGAIIYVADELLAAQMTLLNTLLRRAAGVAI